MKTSRIGLFATVLTLLACAPALAQTGQDLLQQALVMEQAEGNLEDAILLYERIVREFADDRALAARALVQMGGCYEKLGSRDAERAYRRVVTDFADQSVLVEQARSRLSALVRTASEGITTRRIHVWKRGERGGEAPTPDGRRLVVMDWGSGNLHVRDLATGESRFLTRDATWEDPEQFANGARVSPDGRSVAYTWVQAPGPETSLRLVGIDGSNARVLYQEPGCWVERPVWHPNGRSLVAWVHCDESQNVIEIPVAGGPHRVLSTVDPDGQYRGSASLSSEGRFLTYGVAVPEEEGKLDIWLTALDGSGSIPLIQHAANDRLLGWVPGTSEVLFASDRDGRWDVWAVGVEDGVPGSPKLVRRDMGIVSPIGFANDGTLFFNRNTRWSSLSVAPLDLPSGAVDHVSATAFLGSNFQPTWSPDGEYLAFVNEQEGPGGPMVTGYHRPLHIRHLASGAERELAGHIETRTPKWSPDGRFILVNGRDTTNTSPDYRGGLYLFHVESGEATLVVTMHESWWYGIGGVWTKDSRSIIYAFYDDTVGAVRIVRRELDSGSERELYRDIRLTTRQMAVSPDGTRLVFALKDSLAVDEPVTTLHHSGRLMIMDLASGDVQELTTITESGELGSLQWTPDGNHVLFGRSEGDRERTGVWRVPSGGGAPERIWVFGEDQFSGDFLVSPDGRRITLNTFTQEIELWVMENIKAALRGGGER